MAFTDQEKINIGYQLALGLSNLSPIPAGAWQFYNNSTPFKLPVDPKMLWLDFNSILPASNPTEADSNCLLIPTIIEKKTLRLTLLNTTNNRGYISRTTYGDHTSAMVENWLLPSYIQNTFGDISSGYTIRLYNGDPNNGGTEISTSYLSDASGNTSWCFYYGNGLLQIATNNSTTFKSMYDDGGLWIVGYRYIGRTAKDIGSSAGYPKDFIVSDWINGGGVYYIDFNHNLDKPKVICDVYSGSNKVLIDTLVMNDNRLRIQVPYDYRFDGSILII